MKGVFRAALRNELAKFARQKFTYLGFGAIILLAIFLNKSVRLMAGTDGLNGYLIVIKGLMSANTTLIPIFACIFACTLVASETAGGTYRNVLSRPISRFQFLTAKIVFAFAYAFLLIFTYTLVAVVMAVIAGHSFGPIADRIETLYSPLRMTGVFLLAFIFTLVPLMSIVSFGIMVSTLAKSLTSALGIGVGLLIAQEPIKNLVQIGDWEMGDYVVTSYQHEALKIADNAASGIPHTWFEGGWWESGLGLGLTVSLVFGIACLAISYFVFLRRDLNFS